MSRGRILFIDAYDSFSNNIISLLREQFPVSVESIRIDDPRFVFNDDAFHDYLQHFDAVVAGPGPGHPGTPADIGLIANLWTLPEDHALPVLGICLGFQSLCLAFGAEVERLVEPRHGLVTPVTHRGGDIYAKTGDVLATQYHSLHVKLGNDVLGRQSKNAWAVSEKCPQLLPLAYDLSDDKNGPIIMAAKHYTKPFWGVQYHPESICTGSEGHKLIENWWQHACRWNTINRAHVMLDRLKTPSDEGALSSFSPLSSVPREPETSVRWTSMTFPQDMNVAEIVQMLRVHNVGSPEPMLLESGTRGADPVNPETGRFSIIGLPTKTAVHIKYTNTSRRLTVTAGSEMLLTKTAEIDDVIAYTESFMEGHRASGGPSGSPFWGGLIGFTSYETGLATIQVPTPTTTRGKPDVWFVFVERSIAVDHVQGTVYLQSLKPEEESWFETVRTLLRRPRTTVHQRSTGTITLMPPARTTSQPEKNAYCDKVRTCQAHIRAGSSYELCLTDQTHILSHEEPWTLYRRLRVQNPAPFGAYLDLASPNGEGVGIKIISSSPERFLSWTREGECEFRPIKGTVKKGPGVTRAVAEQILSSPKEQAENLMIVDLIRHDLSGVPGYT
jgi:para-aminobenzoate synthetase